MFQATDFQTAVNLLRDFLPQAELELKFQPLPEHELAIMQLMERHEKFEDQLKVWCHVIYCDGRLFIAVVDIHPNCIRVAFIVTMCFVENSAKCG